MNFEVLLKPVGMSRKVKRIAPECVYLLTAADRDDAAKKARQAFGAGRLALECLMTLIESAAQLRKV